MNIDQIIKNGTNTLIVVAPLDLKEAFLQWEKERKNELVSPNSIPVPPEKYFTAEEAAEKLGVTKTTLWRWAKTGYLKKNKVGNKILYKESDVLKLMEG